MQAARWPKACGVLTVVAALAVAGTAAAGGWNLSGSWQGSAGNVMQVHQSGTGITWFAHSADGKAWAHDFTGSIAGTTISGTFQDRPGYQVHNHGAITARIVDDCHVTITSVALNGGPPSSASETFTKSPCTSAQVVAISTVSNGCGGAGWDSVVAVQNYLGNTSKYADSNINPLAHSYTVNFKDACDLHDAGYSGAIVRDKINGGTVDFRTWSRKRVDEKFLADMRVLCRKQIPVRAQTALKNCMATGGNASFGALSRYHFVRRWGHLFFDADPYQEGTQGTGLRANN